MRYKGNFYPSDLLCPETYRWFPLKHCIPKLEAAPYSRLDPDLDSVDSNFPKEAEKNYIPLLVKGVIMSYKTYKRKNNKGIEFEDKMVQYSELVGAKAAKRLILVGS